MNYLIYPTHTLPLNLCCISIAPGRRQMSPWGPFFQNHFLLLISCKIFPVNGILFFFPSIQMQKTTYFDLAVK